MFVVGEQGLSDGIQAPDLEGIYLGTTPIDSLYGNRYAFYWNRNTRRQRPGASQEPLYGTRATPDAGDPQANNDILLCPVGSAVNGLGFSQSYTPTSNASFGCYNAVRNGTGYRSTGSWFP